MNKLVEVLQEQAVGGLQKAPGWAPFLALWFLVLEQADPGGPVSPRGMSLTLSWFSQAVWAGAFTAVFYWIGDVLDDLAFPTLHAWFGSKRLIEVRSDAQSALGIQAGSYRVALNLAKAAGRATKASLLNETAKLMRSIPVPLVIFGATLLQDQLWGALAIVLVALLLGVAYSWLKLWHMTILYSGSRSITRAEKYNAARIEPDVKLFFWDGALVASGSLNP